MHQHDPQGAIMFFKSKSNIAITSCAIIALAWSSNAGARDYDFIAQTAEEDGQAEGVSSQTTESKVVSQVENQQKEQVKEDKQEEKAEESSQEKEQEASETSDPKKEMKNYEGEVWIDNTVPREKDKPKGLMGWLRALFDWMKG